MNKHEPRPAHGRLHCALGLGLALVPALSGQAFAEHGHRRGTHHHREAAAEETELRPISIAKQGIFFAGGEYSGEKATQIRTGQMFVQYQIPSDQRHDTPIVFVHGGGQTGVGFISTPDGREGWATYFLRQGYPVYVVDQAARGRSGYFTSVYGDTRKPDTSSVMSRFTHFSESTAYPQAKLHTQWPDEGMPGDEVFDQFFDSQVEDMSDRTTMEMLNRKSIVALLEKIGPSILLTHSQSGPIGLGVVDDAPDLVSALIAVEPNGPAFYDVEYVGAPDWFKYGGLGRPYGATLTPMTFEPPIDSPEDLNPVQQEKADAENLVRCWSASPARKLPHLAGKPILILGSEASYHVPYDHCVAKFLTNSGVDNDFVRLPDVGIKGNGHMMMLEKNSTEIAAFIHSWLDKHQR